MSAVTSAPAAFRPDFSFSRAALAKRCAFWLKPDVPWTPDELNEYSEGGVLLHFAIGRFLVRGNGIDLLEPDETELRALYVVAKEWLEEHRPDRRGMRSEVAFAFDTATGRGRLLEDPKGHEGTRWYVDPALRAAAGVKPTEICGRIDLVWPGIDEHGGYLYVDDLKFHRGVSYESALDQVELGAVAAADHFGVDRVVATGVHVFEDRVEPEPRTLGRADLDRLAKEWMGRARLPANDPQPQWGGHCEARYCPARTVCPEVKKVAERALALVPPERLARGRSFDAPIASDEDADWNLFAVEALRELADRREKEIRAYADQVKGFKRGDGKVYSGQPVPHESPDLTVPGAIEVLEELHADFAIRESTTWAALTEEGGKAVADKVRARLREMGAVKSRTTTTYMARAPEKLQAARKAV